MFCEYVNGDDDLPTCSEQDDETWEDEFLASIVSDQPPLEQEEPDDVTFDLEPPPLRTLVRLSTHLKMYKPFLIVKDTVIKLQ